MNWRMTGPSTVLMLKEQLSKVIESETKLSPHNQKWIYKGKVLSDSDTLSASGFTDGDTTHVLQTQSTVTPLSRNQCPRFLCHNLMKQ